MRWIEGHPRAAILLGIGMMLVGVGLVIVDTLATVP